MGNRLITIASALALISSGILGTAHAGKEKFERTKPHVNIGTIGHVDHGTTSNQSIPNKPKIILLDEPTDSGAYAYDMTPQEYRQKWNLPND